MKISLYSFILFLSLFPFCTGVTQNLPSLEKSRVPDDLRIKSLSNIYSLKYQYFELKNDTMSIMKYSQSEEFIYKDGNLIKMNQIDPVTGSTSSNSEFDSYGRTVKQFHFVKNAFRPATRYLYNEIDQTSTKIVFGTDSNIIHKTITLYNIRNKPVKTFEFDGKGTLSSSLIYQYNRHVKILKHVLSIHRMEQDRIWMQVLREESLNLFHGQMIQQHLNINTVGTRSQN